MLPNNLFIPVYLITEKLASREGKKHGTLFSIYGGEVFSKEEFTKFIEELQKIVSFDKSNSWGYTSQGYSKISPSGLWSFYEYTINKRDSMPSGMVNLYEFYILKKEDPRGIIIISSHILAFVPYVDNPKQVYTLESSLPSQTIKERKKLLDVVAKKYDLKWWGNPSAPVLYMLVDKPKVDNIKDFLDRVQKFFEETGYIKF